MRTDESPDQPGQASSAQRKAGAPRQEQPAHEALKQNDGPGNYSRPEGTDSGAARAEPPGEDASRADWAEYYTRDCRLALTWMKNGAKKPTHAEWQKKPITDPVKARRHWEQNLSDNMGCVHEHSGTDVFDVDHLEYTRLALAAIGLNADEIIDCGAQTVGNPERRKAWFSLPLGLELNTHSLEWPDPDDPKKSIQIFELRARGGQDVLPKSKHPDGHTYRWVKPPEHGKLPLTPQPLLKLWLAFDEYKDRLRAACPWAVPEAARRDYQSQSRARQAQPEGSVIQAFNAAHDVRAILEQKRYKAVATVLSVKF